MSLAGPDTQVFFGVRPRLHRVDHVLRINAYLEEKAAIWPGPRSDGTDMLDGNPPRSARFREPRLVARRRLVAARRRATASTSASPRSQGDPGIRPEDYVAFRDKLIADLLALRHPVSGEQIIVDDAQARGVVPRQAFGQRACTISHTLVLSGNGFVVRSKEPQALRGPIARMRLAAHASSGRHLHRAAVGPGIPAAGVKSGQKAA